MLLTLLFERPSTSFILGYGGIILILPTIFLIVSCLVRKISSAEKQMRNSLIFLGSSITAGITLIFSGIVPLPSFRYQNAVNPFLLAQDALTDSVSEHETLSTALSFEFLSIFTIFSGIGIWLIFNSFINNRQNQKKFLRNDMLVFVLLVAIFGVFISSAFIRLELFASISVIILSSIGLSVLINHLFSNTENRITKSSARSLIKLSSIFVIICLLIIPLVLPEKLNWVDYAKFNPTILNGGTSYSVAHSDWPHALNWIKTNTSYNSVVFSWWDYGYWITAIGDRITLADNATLIDHQIEKIAHVFLKNEDDAWLQLTKPNPAQLIGHELRTNTETGLDEWKLVLDPNGRMGYGPEITEEMIIETGIDADYVLIFLAGMRITDSNSPPYYILEGGGDESKKSWFIRIAGYDEDKFLQSDVHTPKSAFWNTMLGKMIPFTIVGYGDPTNDKIYNDYQFGLVPVYTPDVKYPGNGDGPFRLVYVSPSIDRTEKGPITAVIIYEINKDYKKLN